MLAFLFPGQGTQRVGMGQRLHHLYAEAREVFERARHVLGYDIADICFRGPLPRLTATQHAQPAIFTCSAAVLAVLRENGVRPDGVGGHSVGEFAALHAAGVLDFDEALAAVHVRAELMASTTGRGTMAAVIGLDRAVVVELCEQASKLGTVVVALHNGPRFVVVSGELDTVAAVVDLAKAAGALRVQPLQVSHAFHSPLMAEVSDRWTDHVRTLPLQAPDCPVALNTTGRVAVDVDDIRRAVADQVASPVEWASCMDALVALGVRTAVEIGESKALTSIVRNTDGDMRGVSLGDAGALERFLGETRRRTTHAL
ncbi:MAG: ACP S-malonyltransferase [Actinobacteria bacterium]|nr:ACP S-malonyltransferase [Actinomycetota bacterium]